MSVPLKLWEFLMSILPTPLKCTPLLLMPNCSLLSLFRHYLNWVRAIKRKSTNQPLQSFVFIKHKGAQTKTYSGCKWSKCQLEKKVIIRFITQINSSSQPFKSLLVLAVKREPVFFFSFSLSSQTHLPLDSDGVILEVLYSWGVPVIGLNWFQNVAIYIIISHYF